MRVGKLDEILVVSRFALEDTVVLLRLLANSSRFLPLSRLKCARRVVGEEMFRGDPVHEGSDGVLSQTHEKGKRHEALVPHNVCPT